MSDGPDIDPAVRALRAANEWLDEQPSAAARARILAQAALQGAARRPAQTPPRRRRWPLPPWFAGASVTGMVAILSAGVVWQLVQEKGTGGGMPGAFEERRNVPLAKSPAVAFPASPAPRPAEAEHRAGEAKAASVAEAKAPAEPRRAPLLVRRESAPPAEAASPRAGPDAAAGKVDDSIREENAPQKASAGALPRASNARGQSLRFAARMEPPAAGAAPAEMPRPAALPAAAPAPSPSVARAAASAVSAPPALGAAAPANAEPPSPPVYRSAVATWLARIRELREQKRDEEAGEELRLFREAHPQEEVPKELAAPF